MDTLVIVLLILVFGLGGFVCYQQGVKKGNQKVVDLLRDMSYPPSKYSPKKVSKVDLGNLLDPITPADQKLEAYLEEQKRKFDEEVDY